MKMFGTTMSLDPIGGHPRMIGWLARWPGEREYYDRAVPRPTRAMRQWRALLQDLRAGRGMPPGADPLRWYCHRLFRDAKWPYQSDQKRHAVSDHWQTPVEMLTDHPGGDCEDQSLLWLASLADLDHPLDRMWLIILPGQPAAHAAAVVEMHDGTRLVMDIHHPAPVSDALYGGERPIMALGLQGLAWLPERRIMPPVGPAQPREEPDMIPISETDMDVLARTLWGEARGEGYMGMAAVAHVVLARVRDPRWPSGIRAVCQQRRQFSCWNEGDPNLAKLRAIGFNDASFRDAMAAAWMAVTGREEDRTQGANHYLTARLFDGPGRPGWADPEKVTVRIGNHVFLKL